jgi:predicted amidohydrolase
MPITRIRVMMMTQDSPIVNVPDDIPSRVQQLQNGFATARGFMPVPVVLPGVVPAPPPPPGDLLRIYLAPEYFFRKNWQQTQAAKAISAYSEAEKTAVANHLQQFSRQLGGSLVIAGSVFWVPAALGSWQIRNTVLIYYNGNLLLEYDKRNDCGELRPWELGLPYRFIPGATPGMFNVQGLSCGVETCVDHEVGQLRRQDGQNNLDLQIIVSNTVTVKPTSVAVQPRGYILHCNAGQFGTNVYQNPFDTDGRITAPQRQADAQLRHAHFDLPWPAAPPLPPQRLNPGLRISP